MAPKTKSNKAPGAPGAPVDGFTPERFSRELKDLASKAKHDSATEGFSGQFNTYARTVVLLALLGIYANVSQLALSPVFGGIPSSIFHSKLVMMGCFTGWAGNLALRNVLTVKTAILLPLVAAYVPLVQFFMYTFSEKLGATFGPMVTECLTLFPLSMLSAACVADYLEGARFGFLPSMVADAAPGIGSWGTLKLFEKLSRSHLQTNVGTVFLYTRLGMETLLTACYAVFAPSKYLVLAIPALLHTAVLNTHVMTPGATASLNDTMLSMNWTILERRESVTGYVSVIESLDRGFRVMRCDHSLLGGQWTMFESPIVQEPIYAIFVLLEAVRLVKPAHADQKRVADQDASALIIGLGIGTTPSAFVAHGIDTTVVEIDPVVHEFADRYFELQENNPAVLQDAVSYTAGLVEQKRQYDYVIHDVFTGGAEPIELFTLEFLQGLSDLLKPDGVVAINYAGDFSLPAPKVVVRTITTVFPTCRIFRESPISEKAAETGEDDFTNMVIFCHKSSSPLVFREAREADFLQSYARRQYLEPQHEVQALDFLEGDDTGLLMRNDTEKMAAWHRQSAIGHWEIMRTVLPAEIWEMW